MSTSASKKRPNFFESAEGLAIKETLMAMAADVTYHTLSTYSANGLLYPDNQISFVDKHMEYLRTHPATDPQHYLSNLRLMTRIK